MKIKLTNNKFKHIAESGIEINFFTQKQKIVSLKSRKQNSLFFKIWEAIFSPYKLCFLGPKQQY